MYKTKYPPQWRQSTVGAAARAHAWLGPRRCRPSANARPQHEQAYVRGRVPFRTVSGSWSFRVPRMPGTQFPRIPDGPKTWVRVLDIPRKPKTWVWVLETQNPDAPGKRHRLSRGLPVEPESSRRPPATPKSSGGIPTSAQGVALWPSAVEQTHCSKKREEPGQ